MDMDIKHFVHSSLFRGILMGLAIAVVALVVFQSGVAFGERRSQFSHRFGDNFERNFHSPEGRMMMPRDARGGTPPSAHGAMGSVVSVALPLVVVAGPDKLEKTIVITKDTVIREFRNELQAGDVIVGKQVVVLGEPNEEGQIVARLIRMVPEGTSASSSKAR